MFRGHTGHYFRAGRDAVRAIVLAMLSAKKAQATRILDMPCGHGRVLRFLQSAFPEASLTACDIDREVVDFCAQTFGATAIYSSEDLDGVELKSTFDLIWVGSLFTHLDRHHWDALVRLLVPSLERNGLLVFTTHGRFAAMNLAAGFEYHPDPAIQRMLLDEYVATGFAYRPYELNTSYGVSLSSPRWIMSQLMSIDSLRLVSFTEMGWDDHQDVVCCQRA